MVLSQKHLGFRFAAAVLFLLIGVTAIAFGVAQFFHPEEGWTKIETRSGLGMHAGEEFSLFYELGVSGRSSSSENRALSQLYTEAMVDSFESLSVSEHYDGHVNLFDLNERPNETLAVDGVLYDALSAFAESGSRFLYFAPVFARYNDLFSCEDDALAADFDPWRSEAVRAEYAEYTAFANDPEAVRIELLGDSRVRLFVSEAYLAYAEENGISCFADFYLARNAVIADYVADTLLDAGYDKGVLTSVDGFSRCLDARPDSEYSFNVYDRSGAEAYLAAVMRYSGQRSTVSFRDFAVDETELSSHYAYRNGEFRAAFIDLKDGMPRAALPTFVGYSETESCLGIFLKLYPLYAAERFDAPAAGALAESGVQTLWVENGALEHTDPDVRLDVPSRGE